MADTSTEAVSRFSDLLARWAEEFASKSSLSALDLDLPRDFSADEAFGFLRALDTGIVKVASGRCSLPAIHRASRKPTEPCLFGVRKGSVYLAWREYVTQVGAVASLVIDYGWPAALVALDPRNWEFDVAGFASEAGDAAMIVACETKKTRKELDKLLSQLSAASQAALPRAELGSLDGHKKYRGLLIERCPFFWAVAPGVRRAFSVAYSGEAAVLSEIEDLPSYPVLSGSRVEPRPNSPLHRT
jgi:hypothetical protein